MKETVIVILGLLTLGCSHYQPRITEYVNPFLGTAPLVDSVDVGYIPREGWRVWAGLTFPGASRPNAMVQLSPVTEFGSGAGYEYEDSVISGFTHTNKGHWNLCNIPVMPVSGSFGIDDFGSSFSHEKEDASPGFYEVFLDRYKTDVKLTSTLRCGYHQYRFRENGDRKLLFNLSRSNERVRGWNLEQEGEKVLKGYQETGNKIFFYAETNKSIKSLDSLTNGQKHLFVISFDNDTEMIELKIGLSFVSVENAKENLQSEVGTKQFEEVRRDAAMEWEQLLSKVKVSGGTQRQKELFYSSLYRSFLWPALRSDVNGEFLNVGGEIVKKDFKYYTNPSLWDTYRNKLVLLGMLSPGVTNDVIRSLIDRGEITGFIPTFFHGDHAAPFISGSYLRGINGFDLGKAYNLLLRNATIEGGTRPFISEYMEKGYIATPEVDSPHVETRAKAGVTKTLEYAYDDYAVALLARQLGREEDYEMLMQRSGNYVNLFDSSTGLMRGRLENGQWVSNFNAEYPYYEYMYREANAWQSSFFVPHDTKGLIELYGGADLFESKLDSLFSVPWNGNYIARNVSSFIGQYCHGNQPDHSFPYLYYFVGKQNKSQQLLDSLMNHFYGMGESGLALCGMDDAGEMSAWYVFSAMGLYPYSPADDEYIVSVPLFDKVELRLSREHTVNIQKRGTGKEISLISCDDATVDGYFVSHKDLVHCDDLIITTEQELNVD
ncbi:GH92 family glycosyl hydrolase [Marinilabilia salmonicolor]|uniref:GH92 family glycosyl hydrolase n=1 Tax=Marinilabilia salmonicolor TaxID=989 RepID=UPI00029A4305|nr:GH92 family glycosyl hydrolase [Marinilabilia salmonicolor]